MDVDGDGTKDMEIELTGNSGENLDSGDFTVLVSGQINVSGTETVNMTAGADDNIIGSSGVDFITLSGAAETGDSIDLAGGADTVNLDNGANTLTISNVETINASPGTDNLTFAAGTIDGTGLNLDSNDNFTNQATVNLTTDTFNAALTNQGLVYVTSGTSAINGTYANAATGTLELSVTTNANANANLTVANGFDNQGTIRLDNDSGNNGEDSFFTVSNGTLTNTGTILATNTGGAANSVHTITAALDNQGTIDVDRGLTLQNGGQTFTNTGTIDVDASDTFTINGGTTDLGAGTMLMGSGEIDFAGTNSINLSDNLTITGASPNLDFNGTVTVGSGNGSSFTVASGGSQTLTTDTFDADLTNQGLVYVTSGTSAINGTYANAATGTLELSVTTNANANLTIANGFDNQGTIRLDNDSGNNGEDSFFTVSNGTLTNTGTILATNTGGAANSVHTITAALDNQGTIDVDRGLTLQNGGQTFTNTGTIDVDASDTFTINGGTTDLGAGTMLMGSGEIDFAGTNSINLSDNLTITGASPNLDFNGTVTVGSGNGSSFTVASGGSQTLTTDTFDADLTNQGLVYVTSGTSAINGTYANAATGTLELSVTTNANANLTIANGFDNQGTIRLDNDSGNNGEDSFFTVSNGTLTNTGTILATNTGGAANSVHTITAALDNQGTIDVDRGLTLNQGEAAHVSSGTIDIDSGDTLIVSGGGTSLTNQSGGVVTGSGTLAVSAITFNNDGALKPGGDGTVGSFSVTGTVNQTDSSGLNIDITGTSTFDVLNVSSAYDVDGTLDLNFASFTPSDGDSFQIVNYGSNAGTTFDTITHNLGAGFDVTASYNAGNITINVTVNTVTWVAGAAGNWESCPNWSSGAQPTSTQDAVIDTFTVTHGGSTDNINSLSLTGGAEVQLNNGTINIASASSIASGTALTLDNATFGGTGTLGNSGTVTVTDATSIDAGFVNNATGTLTVDGGLFTGNGVLTIANGFTNSGLIELDDTSSQGSSLTVSAGTLLNASGATLQSLDSTSGSGTGFRTITGALDNQGAVDIDVDTTLDVTGTTFTNSNKIDVASGKTFTVDGGATTFNGGTNFAGTGTLLFDNSADLTLNSNTTFASGSLNLSMDGNSGTVGGTGSLTIGSSASFNGTTVNVDFDNNGTTTADDTIFASTVDNTSNLTVTGVGSVVGTFTNGAPATLAVSGGLFTGSAALTIAAGFTNQGTIKLDDSSSQSASLTLTSGILTNTGTIQSLDTTAGSGSGGRTLTATVDNQNTIDVDVDLTLVNSGTTFTNSGAIDVASGATFTIFGGTTQLDTGSSFTGPGALAFSSTTVQLGSGGVTADFTNITTSGLQDVTGGGGTDTLSLSETLTSGADIDLAGGIDVLTLSSGNNTFTVSNVETVNAGGGNDTITDTTASGSTAINGGDGDDILIGGAADNVLTGGDESDTLTTGLGNDVIQLKNLSEFGDVITDFTGGASGDTIDFSAGLLAPPLVGTGFVSLSAGVLGAGDGMVVYTVDLASGDQQVDTAVASALNNLSGLGSSVSRYFVVGDGADSRMWRWDDANAGAVDAGELTSVADLTGIDADGFTEENFTDFTGP